MRTAASGKHRAPSESEEWCFMQTALRRKKEYGKRKRSLDCARDDDTRDRFPHISFNPSARANLRPFGAPPSMGRKEKDASLAPHAEGLRYENTAPPHSSFRAKARNLFRSRSGKGCEDSGEREAPCSQRIGKDGVSCRQHYERKRKRETKKIPRLRSG